MKIISKKYEVFTTLNIICRVQDNGTIIQETFNYDPNLGPNADYGNLLKIRIYNPIEYNPWLIHINTVLKGEWQSYKLEDIDKIAKYLVGVQTLTPYDRLRFDFNDDFKIDLLDFNNILGIVYKTSAGFAEIEGDK